MTRGESSLDQRLVESREIFRPSIRQATSCASSGSTGHLPTAIKNAVPYRSDFLVTGERVAMRISPIAPDQLRRLKRDFLGCHPGQAVPVAYQDHGRVAVAVTARGARCRRAAPHVDVRQRNRPPI